MALIKTSEDWQKVVQVVYPDFVIMDPDGWDRKNYQYSWHEELITREEFEKRMDQSTCLWPHEMFEDIAKNGRIDYD